jgi:AcrR family transcriptional regulator
MTLMSQPSNRDRTAPTVRGGSTRDGILAAAAKLFAEKGFGGTTLQDVADERGLTRPAVYHHFKSKDEVLATLVAETSESTAETLRQIRERADLDPTTRLREASAELIRERMRAPERFRMLDRTESSLPSDLASKHRIARRSVLNEVTAMIAEGIDTGHFRATDERLAALSVLGMCNWVAWWYNPAKGESPERIVSVMSESAVAMLARPSHRLPKAGGARGAIEQLREDLDYLDRLIPNE